MFLNMPMKIYTLILLLSLISIGQAHALSSSKNERNYLSSDYPIYQNSFVQQDFNPRPYNGIIKIVSYNIQLSKDINRVLRELKYNDQIKSADVILLQEVVGIPGRANAHAAEIIAKKLNLNYVYAPAFIHHKNEMDFGVAILSRFPIENVKKIILPHLHYKYRTQRIAIGATLHIEGRDLRVYSTHLETLQKSDQRIDQILAINEDIKNQETDHVILGGDFNAAHFFQRHKLLKAIQKIRLVNATQGIGVTMKKIFGFFQVQLDHIFSKQMWIIGKGRARYTDASDHRPIWIVTRIKE
jgi:endonuclease/exonuclease/phosphatase family metal-dependent hydrolase